MLSLFRSATSALKNTASPCARRTAALPSQSTRLFSSLPSSSFRKPRTFDPLYTGRASWTQSYKEVDEASRATEIEETACMGALYYIFDRLLQGSSLKQEAVLDEVDWTDLATPLDPASLTSSQLPPPTSTSPMPSFAPPFLSSCEVEAACALQSAMQQQSAGVKEHLRVLWQVLRKLEAVVPFDISFDTGTPLASVKALLVEKCRAVPSACTDAEVATMVEEIIQLLSVEQQELIQEEKQIRQEVLRDFPHLSYLMKSPSLP